MFPERKVRGVIVPPGVFSEQGRIAADRLRPVLKDRNIVLQDGLEISQSDIFNMMAGIGFPEHFTRNMAMPAILEHISGMKVKLKSEGDKPPYYRFTEPKQKK